MFSVVLNKFQGNFTDRHLYVPPFSLNIRDHRKTFKMFFLIHVKVNEGGFIGAYSKARVGGKGF